MEAFDKSTWPEISAEGLSARQIQGWLVSAPQRGGESRGKTKSWLKTVKGTVKELGIKCLIVPGVLYVIKSDFNCLPFRNMSG